MVRHCPICFLCTYFRTPQVYQSPQLTPNTLDKTLCSWGPLVHSTKTHRDCVRISLSEKYYSKLECICRCPHIRIYIKIYIIYLFFKRISNLLALFIIDVIIVTRVTFSNTQEKHNLVNRTSNVFGGEKNVIGI